MTRDTCQDQTDRIRYLESELDDYRRADEDRREREDRARRERRREREVEIEQSARQAADWPEALRKNAALFQAETEPMDGDDASFIGSSNQTFWSQSAAACDCALEIWRMVEQEKASALAAAEAALAALRDSVRLETARRLRLAEPLVKEYARVAEQIENSTPEEFLNW